MKKKLFALSGVFLIVLVITGLWATRATDINGVLPQTSYQEAATSLAAGLSMQEMVEGADVIAIGKCVETRSQWDKRNLVTLATISVTELLKGGPAETLTVALPGGTDPNLDRKVRVGMTYAGAPQIHLDDNVFLFLTTEGGIPDSYTVMGFAQGKYSIVAGPNGDQLVSRDAVRGSVREGVGNLQVTRLEEFRKRVMDLLGK
ncbi:MAG: hypothetical protein ACREA2_00935 [Blastocatellia bacterium]